MASMLSQAVERLERKRSELPEEERTPELLLLLQALRQTQTASHLLVGAAAPGNGLPTADDNPRLFKVCCLSARTSCLLVCLPSSSCCLPSHLHA